MSSLSDSVYNTTTDSSPRHSESPDTMNTQTIQPNSALRKSILRNRSRVSRTQTILVVGPPGSVRWMHSSSVCPDICWANSLELGRVLWCLQIKQSGDVKISFLITFHKLILFPAHGLWGQAKFQNADSAPFAALVGRSSCKLLHSTDTFPEAWLSVRCSTTIDGLPHGSPSIRQCTA